MINFSIKTVSCFHEVLWEILPGIKFDIFEEKS